MRKRADVRSQSNRHTSCKLFPELLRMQVDQFLLALRSVGSCSVRGEVFRDGKRGHRKNMLFPHQPHGFVAKLKCVINGCNASLCSVQGPGLARCMRSHTLAYASGFVDSSAEFSLCVLIRRRKVSITNRIRTSTVNLDEIGALLELLALCLDELICTVRVSGVRQQVLLGVVADGVFVPAQNLDGIPVDSQPWSRSLPSTKTSPGLNSRPLSTSSKRSAWSTIACDGFEVCAQPAVTAKTRRKTIRRRQVIIFLGIRWYHRIAALRIRRDCRV